MLFYSINVVVPFVASLLSFSSLGSRSMHKISDKECFLRKCKDTTTEAFLAK